MVSRTSISGFSICIKRSVTNSIRIYPVWSCMIRHGFTVLVQLIVSLLATLQLPRKRKTKCIPLASVLLLKLHVCMTAMAVGGDPMRKLHMLTTQTWFMNMSSMVEAHLKFERACSVEIVNCTTDSYILVASMCTPSILYTLHACHACFIVQAQCVSAALSWYVAVVA